jgi:hypothetical protein
VCAICVDRTKGRAEEIRLGYCVTVWLCPGHASHAFQTKRSGGDFVRTLMGVWQATSAADSKPAMPGCATHRSATTHACQACTAHTPSRRTLQRWHAERRWLTRPP